MESSESIISSSKKFNMRFMTNLLSTLTSRWWNQTRNSRSFQNNLPTMSWLLMKMIVFSTMKSNLSSIFMTDQLLLNNSWPFYLTMPSSILEEDGENWACSLCWADRHLYLTVRDNGITSAADKEKILIVFTVWTRRELRRKVVSAWDYLWHTACFTRNDCRQR